MGGGGKGKSKAPATPDYMGLARETGEQNRLAAQELTAANRPNQYDSRGNSLTWTQDPSTGQWSQHLNTSERLTNSQNAYDWWQDGRSNRASLDLGKYFTELENTGPASYTPQNLDRWSNDNVTGNVDGSNVSNALYGAVMDRGRKEQSRETDALNSQLRNSGLQPGSEAYNRAMQNLMTSQNDANLLAGQNAVLAGANEGRAQSGELRAQRTANIQDRDAVQQIGLQNYQANLAGRNANQQSMQNLLSMAQPPQQPSFTGFSGATGYNPTDLMGAANAGFSANMAKTNASNSKKGGLLGAGASLGGSYLGSK
jgi:hypothetical protein